MWSRLRQILEMIRFSHTVFALPFAMLAAVMAWTAPVAAAGSGTSNPASVLRDVQIVFRWRDLLGILLCMVAARSAAMAFNRLVDRDFDAQNPRTARRHVPTGVLSAGNVAMFTAASSAGFIAATLLFLPNRLPLYFSIPVLCFLLAYSYTKRFTALSHFWLGAALMLSPLAAWIALRGEVVQQYPADCLPACWLGLAVLWWVAGFDMIYACQDAEFDVQAGLKSIPARWGESAALRLAALCHLAMVAVLLTLPLVGRWGAPHLEFGWIYRTGVVAIACLLAYEHWLVRPGDLSRVNTAFFHVNAIVSLGLFAIGTLDLLI